MMVEDKRQQEKLKEFDRVLKESTGQLVWFLYWMFAVIGSMGVTQHFSFVRVAESVLLFLAVPMLIGYIGIKISLI